MEIEGINISKTEASETVRGPMTNAEIMEKYGISPNGYAALLGSFSKLD